MSINGAGALRGACTSRIEKFFYRLSQQYNCSSMGKFDLFDYNLYNDEITSSPFFDWTIYAFQGHMGKTELKDEIETLFTQHGMILEIREPTRMVFEHSQINASVEISFEGSVTSDGTRYALCFHSESFGRKIEDALNQKMLYNDVFSLIPSTWRIESYYKEDGKYILIYKTRHRLKLKRKRKK